MGFINEDPAKANKWISIAEDDLKLAQQNIDIQPELLCYHCQQAAEKALKAILVKKEGKFPKTHSLNTLIQELEKYGKIPDTIKEAAESSSKYQQIPMFPFKFPFRVSPNASVSLTEHAEKTRYPGDYLPLDSQALKNAIQKASLIVDWAQKQLKNENE